MKEPLVPETYAETARPKRRLGAGGYRAVSADYPAQIARSVGTCER